MGIVAPIKPFYFDLTEDEIAEFATESAKILRSGNLILGDYTARFESEFAAYIGVRHAVAVNSGSTALEILLRLKGVDGKTVLVPTNTNFATVAAVIRAGGKVRYLDMDPNTFAPTLAMTQAAIEQYRPAGILWVHIGGVISPEFPAAVTYCRERGLFVLEDAAHAHGSQLGGLKAGNLADGAAFSFFPTKVMTTCEGGIITTCIDAEAELARSFRNQGMRGMKFGGLHHDFGNSSRMTEINAMLGSIQLRKLPQILRRRQTVYDIITSALDRGRVGYASTRHMDAASHYKLMVLLPEGRLLAEVKNALAADGVMLGGGVYEVPCHLQPVFRGIDSGAELTRAERWCPHHLCPPMTSGMHEQEAEYVGEKLVKYPGIGALMANAAQTTDFAVIGGGIGGLAVAELLQRSGASVVLLEKNSVLCGGASAEQQGWFHTGALYTALPLKSHFRTMVGNLDDLVDYYSGFPQMNLKVDKHLSTTRHDGWFSNRTNFFVYTGLQGVSWPRKLAWALALRRAKRRMDWFESLDVSRSLSRQMRLKAKPSRFVMHNATLGVNLDHVAFTLKSRDRGMNTRLIARDLLNSFLANGGLVKTRATVTNIESGCVTTVNPADDVSTRYHVRHVILATGKDSVSFDQSIRVLSSPLLVAYPALTDMNFVKMTPHMKETINHIYHQSDGLDYSLIGNAVYYAPDQTQGEGLERIRRDMISTASRVFPELESRAVNLYFGYKTEITSSASRRDYLYHIVDRGAFTMVLPGKFSLCFSLAVNICRHFGIEPVERVKLQDNESIGHLIEEPLHQRIAKRLRTQVGS